VPLYVYRCKQCGQRLEKIQHFKSKPEVVCPKCQGALERVLTAPSFKFKGSGWYVNDYGGKTAEPAPVSAPAAAPAAAKTPCGGSCGAACPAVAAATASASAKG
jgi:putative FmdB family regulatory protein